jgi:membrane protease subunit HflK
MIILVAVFLASGFFTVGPQQQAIILRLGRPVTKGREALLGPGLHYSFPYPIDEAVIVSISGLQQVRSSIGWFAVTPEEEMAHTEQTYMLNQPLNPVVDGYVITGDANIVHARATLTYHISDPIRYVFDFASGSNTVQNLLNSALLEVASRYKVDDLLTTDVIGFKDAVRRRTTELLERQNLGLVVDECTVETRPPRQLQEAFRNVIQAEVKRSTAISDARTYENQTLARAGSDAAARTNLARAAVTRYLNDVASRAKQFQELLPKYQQNPDLFVQQRLAETIGRALTNVNDKFFVTRSAEGDRKELRLQLNREPINPQPATPAKP